MAELPILPLKTDALLADTTHMTAEEFGAYCRILFVMWRHEAKIPHDAGELAQIAGVSKARWEKIAERVLRPMTIVGGVISQKRLTATWLDVQELRKKRASAAASRWKQKDQADGMQMHMQNVVTWNANQNQRR